MKRVFGILFVLICVVFLMSFSKIDVVVSRNTLFRCRLFPAKIKTEKVPDLTIKEGYVSQEKETIKIVKNSKIKARIKLGKPILVAQAEEEEGWGFFQFPGIYRTMDEKLIVSWQMCLDSHKSYGKVKGKSLMSRDEGKTWEPLDKGYYTMSSRSLKLHDGNIIQISTPATKKISDYASFPQALYKDISMKMDYYFEAELPDDLKGVYLRLRDGNGRLLKDIHGTLEDSGLLRYSIGGVMPVKWWGDMKELADGSLVAGVYPSCYLNHNNEVPKSDITFYWSVDGGYNWKAVGKIPFKIEKIKDKNKQYDKYQGFSEATFDILKDSVFFCVMRTGYNTPMYKTFSYDKGKHWTEPEAFTPNGVRPQLLQLDNGVMVMVSGRPGVQLRFCLEGDGREWTEPIEMMPFMDENGEYDLWGISCGYARMLQVESNTFYLVYSDFKTKNEHGEYRKSIMFRKIEVYIKY